METFGVLRFIHTAAFFAADCRRQLRFCRDRKITFMQLPTAETEIAVSSLNEPLIEILISKFKVAFLHRPRSHIAAINKSQQKNARTQMRNYN